MCGDKQYEQEKSLNYYQLCRICNSPDIETAINLEATPPADMFLPVEQAQASIETYPLELALCMNCGYLHLPWVLNPDLIYPEFSYKTSTTVGLSEHYVRYADELLQLVPIGHLDLIVDIGSNEGSFLSAFGKTKARRLGVEPSCLISEVANRSVPTVCGYFEDKLVEDILRKEGKAKLITVNYTYANVENILDFTRNVKRLLAEDGLFVVQTGYHPDQMKILMFDYIYHEHLSYFTVDVLQKLFQMSGLELISVSRNSMKGGSIRVVAQHSGGGRDVTDSVRDMSVEEESLEVEKISTYHKFSKAINEKGIALRCMLDDFKKSGNQIVGYGASHSTTTLLHHLKIADYLDYLVDDNPIKQGTVSPGYHLPVYSPSRLYEEKVNYIAILAWQHAESILSRNAELSKFGKKFIVPLPSPQVC